MQMKEIEKRDPWDVFPVDEEGRPTTYLSYRLLKTLFSQPRRQYTTEELSEVLASMEYEIEVMLKQLALVDIVQQDPSSPRSYRYNLSSRNVEMQANLETFLLDVELEGLPVHVMLDYSPTVPSRRPPSDPAARQQFP
jgi:hypothetical protein